MPTEPSPLPLADCARFAEGLARRGGARAMEWFRRPVRIETKSDASPVTEADRATEALMRAEIAARFPGHAVLGEEYGAEGAGDAPLWVLDPIDGTRSFITGWPLWGVLVALCEGGHPLLGVVEMPALNERFLAVRGQGARFTDARGQVHACRTRAVTRLDEARFYTTSPQYFDPPDRPRIEALIEGAGIARFGGDCYSYALLAAGQVDLVVESRLQPYDYLALMPLIEEAGGVITDWNGAALDLASDGRVVAAATPALHAEALARLGG